ncbi:hypothetical protein [Anaerofustis butyriciformans]|uniref:hypothetical protein n=1 Tax=Anaerofustis butyriciformans TaxID=3108533 RepID=UPI002E30EA9D|nr:hypothetical protein [Anaerofustis sp. HA2171]
MEENSNKNKRKEIINTTIFLILIFIGLVVWYLFFSGYHNPNKGVEKSLKNSCVENLSNEEGNEYAQEYRMIMELMFSSKNSKLAFSAQKSRLKYIDKNTDYKIVGEKEVYNPPKSILNRKDIDKDIYTYVKLKIKVIAPNYALAYKNSVDATNKYIKDNKEATKEEIEMYFANRLKIEGEKVVTEDKSVNYIYKARGEIDSSVSPDILSSITYYAGLLPDQENNLDLVNAMLGGLVEEMDRTKLPEGVDLEETLQLMRIE